MHGHGQLLPPVSCSFSPYKGSDRPTDRRYSSSIGSTVVTNAAVAVETIQSMLPLLPLGLVCVRACVCCWFRGERKKRKEPTSSLLISLGGTTMFGEEEAGTEKIKKNGRGNDMGIQIRPVHQYDNEWHESMFRLLCLLLSLVLFVFSVGNKKKEFEYYKAKKITKSWQEWQNKYQNTQSDRYNLFFFFISFPSSSS